MKELQDKLVAKISELVGKADEKDVDLLDVLGRLLGTVSNNLIANK